MAATIYMDHNATTPVDARVLERMLPYFSEKFGNAASRSHAYGWQADEAVEEARRSVATLIGAQAQEIVFTSGATEANNMAILGVAAAYASRGKHIVTQATEHKAVLDPCDALQKRGWEVTVVPVDATGGVDPQAVRRALRDDTVLVSIMTANNEIGTVQPLGEIGALCHARDILFHTDAAQGAGRVAVDVNSQHLDLVSLSAHKIYGPKGVGALYVRRRDPRVTLVPQMFGGGQERGRRAGTLNVPGIVGFGAAATIAASEGQAESVRLQDLVAKLYDAIVSRLPDVHLNGPPLDRRLAGNLSVAIPGVEADAIMMALRDVAFSSGAACSSTTLEPSHVLRAIGVAPELARASVRLGLGRSNTRDEVEHVANELASSAQKLRTLGRRA